MGDEILGYVDVIQDIEGGLTVSGGSFARPDLSAEEFLKIECVELKLKRHTLTFKNSKEV